MSRALLSSAPRRAVSVGLAAGLLGGLLVGFAAGEEPLPASEVVAAVEVERSPLPVGDPARGRVGVERSALELAAALDAVPLRPGAAGTATFCPVERLEVRWDAPLPGEFAVGGHIDPIGPPPGDDAVEVNGLVVCAGSSYAYMGFEARWTGAAWSVAAVPALSDEHELEGAAHGDAAHEEDAAPPVAPRTPAPAPRGRGFAPPSVSGIDPYAAYDPQRVCDPVAKPGTVALRDLLLRTHPGTRSLGISRTCTARGTSEHKEGRAFDWGVRADRPQERAAAESVLRQLLATDSAGNRHALARRLGVMYLIWDRQIWSSYSAARGWRPYGGANAHTDHVHLSLSWDGAMGRTSYWSGANAKLLTTDPELRLVSHRTGAAPAPVRDDAPREPRRHRDATAVPAREGRAPRSLRPTTEAVRVERDSARAERRRAEREAARDRRRDRPTAPARPATPAAGDAAVVPEAAAAPSPVRSRTSRPERQRSDQPRAERTARAERPRAERTARPERVRTERVRTERVRTERARSERSRGAGPRQERPRRRS